MDLHYQNKIGLVPLSKTVHDLTHDGEIFINFKSVFGKFNEFIDEYIDYIPENLINKYNKLLDMSNSNVEYSTKDILKYSAI
jgi:hypothetical protein